ncbi:class I SAM-dependent methyltransferase [Streptomyces sp. TRM66268-LWL]|uniref:Class I SAM-dependent methyltransferase n=1 Tax=Streptomyces polyasparticus TaxID=2767826 RepID=A0ABR7S836_9ACTN|nr:class I SAM-dependent methyltransferase [Streptomyces polyasparticus]MBC9711289.1 class I SAM-dependent methyltransferase [Streptomyces polyasparticus]
MDRQKISSLAHADHPIAAPLYDSSVDRLLSRALPRGDERVLDLGCGEAAWLVRAASGRPGVRGDGVDVSESALARGWSWVEEAGLTGRVDLHLADAAGFQAPQPYDLVMCVGATHAFGGLLPTLEAAGKKLAEGGSVLVGDGFWEREPGAETLEVGFSADEFADLATTVDRVTEAGWVPTYAYVSTLAEWDDYEWSWTGTLARWALDHPEDPDAKEAAEAAVQHRNEWLRGYRGTLGFVTMVLRRAN